MTHTSGQWTYSARIDEGYRVHTIAGGMADAIADIDEWQTKEETEANARLIASAPELLATLKLSLQYLHKMEADGVKTALPVLAVINRVGQAIEKAEGR